MRSIVFKIIHIRDLLSDLGFPCSFHTEKKKSDYKMTSMLICLTINMDSITVYQIMLGGRVPVDQW